MKLCPASNPVRRAPGGAKKIRPKVSNPPLPVVLSLYPPLLVYITKHFMAYLFTLWLNFAFYCHSKHSILISIHSQPIWHKPNSFVSYSPSSILYHHPYLSIKPVSASSQCY